MKKIKVLHVLVRIGSGGVEQRRLLLANNLDKSKYQQILICTDQFGDLPAELDKDGCEVINIGLMKSIFDFSKYLKVIKIIRQYKPDIIHGAVFEGVALATIAGTLARVPMIVAEETSDPANRRWRGHLLTKFFFALADKAVGVSPFVSNYLKTKLNINADKVVTIMNGVANRDVTVSNREKVREQLDITEDTFLIGFVGRLEDDMKQVSLLIRVLEKLVNDERDVHLLIVGDGVDKSFLDNLSSELNLSAHITFVGYQSATEKFYAAMDLFCLASKREAFGLVLAEAMFAKVPVVASNVGGIPYVVEDGVSGLLAESGDVADFHNKILRVMEDRMLRNKLIDNGYSRALQLFSEESYCNAVDTLYTELVDRAN